MPPSSISEYLFFMGSISMLCLLIVLSTIAAICVSINNYVYPFPTYSKVSRFCLTKVKLLPPTLDNTIFITLMAIV